MNLASQYYIKTTSSKKPSDENLLKNPQAKLERPTSESEQHPCSTTGSDGGSADAGGTAGTAGDLRCAGATSAD